MTPPKLNYLTPDEFKMSKDEVNMQIVLGLQTCNTKQDCSNLLDDVRAHERANIQQLEADYKNLKECNEFRYNQVESLKEEVEDYKGYMKNADANILKLADSYNGLNRVHVEALAKIDVVNKLLALYPKGVYTGGWGTDDINLQIWIDKLRGALK